METGPGTFFPDIRQAGKKQNHKERRAKAAHESGSLVLLGKGIPEALHPCMVSAVLLLKEPPQTRRDSVP